MDAGVPREQIEGSAEEGLAAQEVIEAAIRSFQNGTVEEVRKLWPFAQADELRRGPVATEGPAAVP